MEKQKFESMLMHLVSWVILLITEDYPYNEVSAAKEFYDSKVSSLLEQEDTKLWHLSALTLFHMFDEEIKTGRFLNCSQNTAYGIIFIPTSKHCIQPKKSILWKMLILYIAARQLWLNCQNPNNLRICGISKLAKIFSCLFSRVTSGRPIAAHKKPFTVCKMVFQYLNLIKKILDLFTNNPAKNKTVTIVLESNGIFNLKRFFKFPRLLLICILFTAIYKSWAETLE